MKAVFRHPRHLDGGPDSSAKNHTTRSLGARLIEPATLQRWASVASRTAPTETMEDQDPPR